MPKKISEFFDSKETAGRIHTCILLCILFLIMAAVHTVLYFFAPGHSITNHIAPAAVNVVTALVSAAVAVCHCCQQRQKKSDSDKEN